MPLQSTSGAATYDAFGVSAVSAAVQAEAIDFDGTNDFLSRGDLTGNTTSRTFTFSAWIWADETDGGTIYRASGSGSSFFRIELLSTAVLRVSGTQSTGSNILVADFDFGTLSDVNRTFFNILISVDLSNTARRFIYINDIQITPSWTTYTNGLLQFSQPTQEISPSGQNYRGRLSNVFLDYTYRDLSVTANRRLFVTADLKPAAGQAALNPIMYLPMSNPTAPGTNTGTGGDFTLTGVVARSGRGPNQYNVPYSTLDGANDFLTRSTVPTGLVDGKQFTFQCSFIPNNIASNNTILSFSTAGNQRLGIWHNNNGQLGLFARNSSGTTILSANVTSPTFVIGRNYTVTVSLDLADFDKKHIYINGVAATSVTWNTYTNDNIDFAVASDPIYNIGCANDTVNFFNGRLGAVWFNTSYIDLSVATNRAKFVSGTGINAAPVDPGATGELPTGTSPLLYLPMYGNNAGRNYGTGGDFSVNSGPYAGARGPNEFWGNRAVSNGTTGFFSRSALSGVTDGTTFTFCCWFFYDANAGKYLFNQNVNTTTLRGVNISVEDSKRVVIQARNSSGTVLVNSDNTAASMVGTSGTPALNSLMISIDVTDSAKRFVYVNGVAATLSFSTYTNGSINFSSSSNLILRDVFSSAYNSQPISELYFSTQYIDLSQEANRLKFRDAFGNPTNLPLAITSGSVPSPAIYMRFPPTAFGTNSGTGGDFTVNGTITDGGQI